MDIMNTYFFCRCLVPPDYGNRDISVQHLDIIKIDIINLSFGKLFRIFLVSAFPEGHLMYLYFVSRMSNPGKVLRVASN